MLRMPGSSYRRDNARRQKRPQAWRRRELSGTTTQRSNLEHEIHHAGSKLCILGFEPLEWPLIAAFGHMSIRTAPRLPSVLTGHLQTQHVLDPVWSRDLVHEPPPGISTVGWSRL